MVQMIRFRRYRVFVFCAVVLVFLLYRVGKNSQWEAGTSAIYNSYSHAGTRSSKPVYGKQGDSTGPGADRPQQQPLKQQPAPPPPPPPLPARVETEKPQPTVAAGASDHARDGEDGASAAPATTDMPAALVNIPDRDPRKGGTEDKDDGKLHMMDPPRARQGDSTSTTSTVHWHKVPEHFPVPTSEIIPLPTGKPKKIPKVQADEFPKESADDRVKREERLAQIKAHMVRGWKGYREYAWTHDELTPVTRKFRDPFCGWAATLVDALDTLWIMGMKEEFDDAYAEVGKIDFTTTPYRTEIPVFETIIRYLGGLIAAFDMSGGKEGNYPLLLKKAEELAEILMGVFDTPNRMPVLYYQWQPEFAEQPHRASSSVSVAELGSMSMEFTRLAQLTGNDHYYDAIARITDAFEEWQLREPGQGGTALPGIFPQQIDASGCNRTAEDILAASKSAQQQAVGADLSEPPEGFSPTGSTESWSASQSKKKNPPKKTVEKEVELKIHPGDEPGSAGKAEFQPVGELKKKQRIEKRTPPPPPFDYSKNPAFYTPDETVPGVAGVPQPAVANMHPNRPSSAMNPHAMPVDANGNPAQWDCIPQNLTVSRNAGLESYSMGGSQDSMYEYLPKQYLLTGGLEPKYRAMHEKVVAANKKYLLFRPMLKDDRNVLFAAKAYSHGTDENLTFDYEVTHLACFLGGMFGLGGRIFESEEDVEIAKRLADGCVWAYESTVSGIMPEYFMVVPCASTKSCPWNETVWWDHLDPNWEWRERQITDYETRRQEWEQKKEELLKQEEMRIQAEEEAAAQARLGGHADGGEGEEGYVLVHGKAVPKRKKPDGSSSSSAAGEIPASDNWMASTKQKRQLGDSEDGLLAPPPKKKKEADFRDTSYDPAGQAQKVEKDDSSKNDTTADATQNPLGSASKGTTSPQPPRDPLRDLPPEPNKPLSHKEYVTRRIETEHLPPGYTSVIDRRYILRPEAIESVWYMYRITGDPIWQEKGWRMWKAVANHTATSVGNSAINDVIYPGVNPGDGSNPNHGDNMESFWMAETLKYFYLLFATPDVVSLDEWVLNTEAHPFKRPT